MDDGIIQARGINEMQYRCSELERAVKEIYKYLDNLEERIDIVEDKYTKLNEDLTNEFAYIHRRLSALELVFRDVGTRLARLEFNPQGATNDMESVPIQTDN